MTKIIYIIIYDLNNIFVQIIIPFKNNMGYANLQGLDDELDKAIERHERISLYAYGLMAIITFCSAIYLFLS